MSDLFRKSSLEKLSSPEQLDRAIVLTPPAFWVALLGGFLIVASAAVWSVFGRIPVNVDAQGIYLSGAGTAGVYAQVEGMVTEVKVAAGDEVKADDVVAVVGGEDITAQIEALQKRIDAVNAVTLTGTNDTATADNKPLLDVKYELTALSGEADSDSAALAETRFETTKAVAVSELQIEQDRLKASLENHQIVAFNEGVVQEVVVERGDMVAAGSPVVKLKMGKEDNKEVLCYMPLSDGKRVAQGMEVMVYPTTVNKQEYGHMTATVKEVATYVTSRDEMLKRLGDETLVEAFLANGPVVAVVCALEEDAGTASGYKWSSKKGAAVTLADGTMLEASVITEKKAPITMIIPLLKQLFLESSASYTEVGGN